jgi:hypothetical protein
MQFRPTLLTAPVRTNFTPCQIDLTDDYVVMALFGDGSWEDQVREHHGSAFTVNLSRVS